MRKNSGGLLEGPPAHSYVLGPNRKVANKSTNYGYRKVSNYITDINMQLFQDVNQDKMPEIQPLNITQPRPTDRPNTSNDPQISQRNNFHSNHSLGNHSKFPEAIGDKPQLGFASESPYSIPTQPGKPMHILPKNRLPISAKSKGLDEDGEEDQNENNEYGIKTASHNNSPIVQPGTAPRKLGA